MRIIYYAGCVMLVFCLLPGNCRLRGDAFAVIGHNNDSEYIGGISLTGCSIGNAEISDPVLSLDVE